MDFELEELSRQAAATARDFALQYVKPHVMEWDEVQHFPVELMRAMGKLGLMGVLVPEEYGGAGMSYTEYVLIIEEIAKVCGSIGLSLAAHNSLCTGHILAFGNEKQKKEWLPKLASAEWIGSWGLTEANTGSDAANMQCTATQDGNDWILNGTKNWITHGISSNISVVVARTGSPRTKNNATAFVVLRGTTGFKGGKKENKLGMRASETAEMVFDNCRIPDEWRLGEIGSGFKQSLKVLDGEEFPSRPWVSALPKELMKRRCNTQRRDISSISRSLLSRGSLLNWRIWRLKLWRRNYLPCRRLTGRIKVFPCRKNPPWQNIIPAKLR